MNIYSQGSLTGGSKEVGRITATDNDQDEHSSAYGQLKYEFLNQSGQVAILCSFFQLNQQEQLEERSPLLLILMLLHMMLLYSRGALELPKICKQMIINIKKDTSLFSEQKLDGSPNIIFYEIREPCDLKGNHPEIDLSDWEPVIVFPNLTGQFYLQQHKHSQGRSSLFCTRIICHVSEL